jgi:hypothetical protein
MGNREAMDAITVFGLLAEQKEKKPAFFNLLITAVPGLNNVRF